ncbi:MAG: phytochelatin synthase family protein [Alphaproteobacteria bacterium]|nr:phytochelatin synthase family protein [Alphaproteobacteria bacterium]
MNARRWLAGAALVVLSTPVVAFGAAYWVVSHPSHEDLPLPPGHTALSSPAGAERLERAVRADHPGLIGALQTQEKASWCGVASAVTVLNAAGGTLTQDAFFTPEAREVRGWLATTFTGMTLDAFAGMVRAHGLDATPTHAEDASVEQLRAVALENLGASGDWLVVNYDRREVGEAGGGHLSPLSAYDPETDEVLLLDVAGYKYPPHWVPLERLFAAMDTRDGESGRSRGWVVVRQRP